MGRMRAVSSWIVLALAFASSAGADELIPKSKRPTQITPEALLRSIMEGRPPLILDVRPPIQFARGHIPGAVNVPSKQVPGRWDEIEPHDERGVVVLCQRGMRTRYAARALQIEGLERVGVLTGFMDQWLRRGYPIERPAR